MIKQLKLHQIGIIKKNLIQFINNSENLIDEIKKMRILLKIITILIIIKLQKKKYSIQKMIKQIILINIEKKKLKKGIIIKLSVQMITYL